MLNIPRSLLPFTTAAVLLASCGTGEDAMARGGHHHDHDHDHSGSYALAANEGGYLIVPETASYEPGMVEVAFRIIGRTGEVQTEFEEYHEELMHLVAFPHELTRYVHEHPSMDPDGTWRARIPAGVEGPWRIVADFLPSGGEHIALGYDIQVGQGPGEDPWVPAPYGEPGARDKEIRVARNGEWQAVLTGETAHERPMPLRLSLTKDGRPALPGEVSAWMGEDAHLVAILAEPEYEDMFLGGLPPRNAYIHLHPNGSMRDGVVTFTAPETPHGWWYLFLEMVLDGERKVFNFIVWAP